MGRCVGVGTKECYSVVSSNGDLCRSCQFDKLKAANSLLKEALEESVRFQSHYAKLLNMYDAGERMEFKDANEWIERLEKIEGGQMATLKYSDIKHVGNEPQRKKYSYEEKIFADKWEELNDRKTGTNGGYGALELLLDKSGYDSGNWTTHFIPVDEITERDAFVAATTIQWLGTKCGCVFLWECEQKIKEEHKKEMEEFHKKYNLHVEENS
jgi:hypothetical protein